MLDTVWYRVCLRNIGEEQKIYGEEWNSWVPAVTKSRKIFRKRGHERHELFENQTESVISNDIQAQEEVVSAYDMWSKWSYMASSAYLYFVRS